MDILRKIKADGHDLPMYGTVEEPLFLAVDVAKIIDYSVGRTSEMISRVDPNEKILMNTRNSNRSNTHGSIEGIRRGNPEKWFLTEYGLYEVLMQSRKPIARRFKSAVKDMLHDLRIRGEADFEDWLNHSDPLVDEWEDECSRRDDANEEELTFNDFLRTKGYTDDMLGDD